MAVNTVAINTVISVFEARPYWGPELQRQFENSTTTIRECRSLSDLIPSTQGFDAALIVIDLESDLENALAWFIENWRESLHTCPLIACGSPSVSDLEWILRETGVTAFLPEVLSGDAFARLCRRHLNLPANAKSSRE